MSNIPLRFALIGCGAIARKHVAALTRIEDVEVVGVFDKNEAAAKTFGEEHDLPCYRDIETLVAKADPHFFQVLTPSGVHGDNILELVRYGRHFVVEKPLALRLDQLDQVLEACDRHGLKIFVVQQNRCNPPLVKLKEAIDADRFGKLVMGTVRVRWSRDQAYYDAKAWRGTWALDGGVLTNQASHHIDMLLWMMGDVESVVAKTATRLVDIEAEDTGVAIIKFRSGALGIVEATTATRPKDLEGSLSVLGERGSVVVGGFFMNELSDWHFEDSHPMDEDIWERHSRVPDTFAWNHEAYLRGAIDAFRQGKRGLVDGLEGRRSIEVINAIYESSEQGKEIHLNYYRPRRGRLGVGV